MHRCQVRVHLSRKYDDDFSQDCGDTAVKKIGKIWVCEFHYAYFKVPELGEDYFAGIDGAEDFLSSRPNFASITGI